MASEENNESSSDTSVPYFSNECDLDLIIPGNPNQHPLSVKKKPKRPFSTSKNLGSSRNLQIKSTSIEEVALKTNEFSKPDIGNASNQVITISKGNLKDDINDFELTKTQYYASVLRSLPNHHRLKIEKEISCILVNSQVAAGLDVSQAISMWHGTSLLPSNSKKYLHGKTDIFDIQAQSYMNILRNLPKEKFEEVDQEISYIFLQAKITSGEESQENLNYTGLFRESLVDIVRKKQESKIYPRIPEDLQYLINDVQNEEGFVHLDDHNEPGQDISPQNSPKESVAVRERRKRHASPQNFQQYKGETSPRLYKGKPSPTPFVDKPPPQPTASYNYVKQVLGILVILLCAIAAVFFSYPHWLNIVDNFTQTHSQPELVESLMADLRNEFGWQPAMTFKVIDKALRRVTKPNSEAPAIILMLAEEGSEDVAGQFARKIADSVSSTNKPVLISGQSYDTDDPDEAKKKIDDLLLDNLSKDQLQAVLVDRLDKIPPEVAGMFRTYCDHKNASFKRVVYLMTIVPSVRQLKSLTPFNWDTIANDHLSKSWSKGGNDQVTSLLSRITVSVVAIVSGA